jgi:hypothetical protein
MALVISRIFCDYFFPQLLVFILFYDKYMATGCSVAHHQKKILPNYKKLLFPKLSV